ncbi:MAG: hypothetical protein IJO24_07780 [Clostridia bacterium]|nr:hypothetical protein [Clostridia bacterium]
MKKVISVFLAVVMVFSVFAVTAAAATNAKVKYPIIFIAGSSVDLFDAEGNEISTGIEVLTDDDEGDGMGMDKIVETTVNILKPFVMEGLLQDKWDNYGKVLYDEFAPIWDEGQLDGDGNTKYGIGVSASEISHWDNVAATVDHGKDGTFGYGDYKFRYDWRLSPYDHVDRLHEFIKTILNTTKCEKVCLIGRCIGGNVINAYLDTYGSEGLVAKVMFDEVMSNGSATVNDCYSGKIKFSDKHLQAFLLESEYFGKENIGLGALGLSDIMYDLIKVTTDLAVQTGVVDGTTASIEALYDRLGTAFLPAVLRATGLGTWPGYWASVYAEDVDDAIDFVFGEEGTETREENAGLIEKIEYIRDHMAIPRSLEGDENLYKIFANKYGVEIGILAGYGLVQAPLTESHDETGDCTVGVGDASFGATAAGAFDTLPEDYIAERVALGYGKYISPDKKIDASTCLFPETTWFVKNKHHDTLNGYKVVENFCRYENYTVDNNPQNASQFLITTSIHGSGNFVNMTEENCADGYWITDVVQKPDKATKLQALISFLRVVIKIISELFGDFISSLETA